MEVAIDVALPFEMATVEVLAEEEDQFRIWTCSHSEGGRAKYLASRLEWAGDLGERVLAHLVSGL